MSATGLELHGLRRSFGELVAVADVSFAVEPGRLFGFVGRNGAGKTTTMRMICGLLAPDGGSVTWHGRPIDATARERIGYMPQDRGLYPKMRVADQLEYLAVLHGAEHTAARAAALGWLDRLGLSDRANARADELSQGNQQRVQLAAALVHGPDLLVLDEPFAGLDPIVTDVLTGVLREQSARGVPILFSSHQLELVEDLCESVAIIDGGRVLAWEEVDRLRAAGPRMVRIDVRGAAPGWAEAIPDTRVVERTGDRVVLELGPAADSQRVLDAARAAGDVGYFAERDATLAELFRELVAP